MFTKDSWVRSKATVVVSNPWFSRIVMALVLGSCLLLALDDPGCKSVCQQKAVLSKVIFGFEWVCVSVRVQ